MLRPTWFPAVALVLLPVFALSGEADEKRPASPGSGEIVDLEFEVKKRELACEMADLGIEEAKITLEKLKRVNSVEDEDLAQAALHIEMRKLAAQAARVELDQVKARLMRQRKTLEAPATIEHPVQIEYVEGLDVFVTRGSKEDVGKVAALIQEAAGGRKEVIPIHGEHSIEMERLLKQYRDTLRQVADLVEEQYRQGRAQPDDVIRASGSLMEVELDLATDKAERIALCEKRVEILKSLEEFAKAKQDVAAGTSFEVLTASAARMEAEIELFRERASER